jgi:hypothetical protein
MDIAPYADRLRADLVQTAAAGDDHVRAAAERLASALDPALRLALMEVLSEAAAEITSAMRTGSVEARLHGRAIDFAVVAPAPAPAPAAAEADDAEEDEGVLARLTLRLPESVKNRAEELAAKSGQSLNTWVVQALRRATREGAVDVDIDLSSIPLFGQDFPFGRKGGPRRMSGWV